jgi:RNA polymerase sigma-70 factor (ECF subfamily)
MGCFSDRQAESGLSRPAAERLGSEPPPATSAEAAPAGAAGEEVVRCYQAEVDGLYRYASLLLGSAQAAEDVLQEVFLRLFVALRGGAEIRNSRAWLYRVTRNACLARRRQRRSQAEVEMPSDAGAHAVGDSPEADYQRRHLARQIARRLTPRELECVRLRAEGLSYAEIGEVLNIRCGTVGALLNRALARCRAALGKAV